MWRSPANLLLAMLLWVYAAPGFFALTELDLPACCRHHGVHHVCHCGCACRMGQGSDDLPGYHRKQTPCRCPLLGTILHADTTALVARHLFAAPISRRAAAWRQLAARRCRARIWSRDRAPPPYAA